MKRGALLLVGACFFAQGCGGSKEEKKADATPAAPAAGEAMVTAPPVEDVVNHCVKLREQLFLCKEEAIEMLMEERAKANPDFAKAFEDSNQRATLRTQGLTELEADGGGDLAGRQAKCREMATKMPQQVPAAMLDLMNSTASCWDKPCGDRVNCLRPFTAATMKSMAAKPQ